MQSPYTGKPIKLPAIEILKSIPEIFGIRLNEEPEYDVIEANGDVEVRRYPPVIIASVTIAKQFDEFKDEAFKRLAAYIFGENYGGKHLAMTSPVLQQKDMSENIAMTSPVLQSGRGNQWTMSFVLPKEFVTREPPTPIDPSITLTKVKTRSVASYRYSGTNSEKRMAANRATLDKWIKERPDYEAIGDIFWAQYDAPFVIPFLKTNEVCVEVRSIR